ncbi:MAG: TIGR03619 family F420-dependent LLM class oxidoreductase [SAR202 cluster bacterium]|nr:TIGR03619 family F420-dependent LLM class oxidoreductase [SAR202 cluster bacterium]
MSKPKVRIGFAPGQFPDSPQGHDTVRQLAHLGDEVGYDSVWFSDRVVGGRFPLEPIVALSMTAAYSPKLKFGASVLALPLRNPVLLAKELATLDYLSKGRLLPAVGLGQDDPAEYQACGVSKEGRAERTDEAITVMRRLWQEDSVTHHGRFFSFDDVSIVPKPFQKPAPPIWIGGRSKAAQKRTGRLGDGWLVSQATPQEIEQGCRVIFAAAGEHGRAVDEGHIGTMLGFCIAADDAQAALIAQPYLGRPRDDMPFQHYTALGPPRQISSLINDYIAAGATKFVARPLCPADQAMSQLRLFGQEILPLFHR